MARGVMRLRKGGSTSSKGQDCELSPRMVPREGWVDHLTALARNVKKDEGPIGVEPINSERMPGSLTPRAMSELVKVRVARNEEELLVGRLIIVVAVPTVSGARRAHRRSGRVRRQGGRLLVLQNVVINVERCH